MLVFCSLKVLYSFRALIGQSFSLGANDLITNVLWWFPGLDVFSNFVE